VGGALVEAGGAGTWEETEVREQSERERMERTVDHDHHVRRATDCQNADQIKQ
jgi:hypothetical protein